MGLFHRLFVLKHEDDKVAAESVCSVFFRLLDHDTPMRHEIQLARVSDTRAYAKSKEMPVSHGKQNVIPRSPKAMQIEGLKPPG